MSKGKGMPGGMGNMSGMMKQIQKMQQDMEKTQKELEETIFEGKSGGGAVVARVNGKRYVKEIVLEPEILVPEDSEMVADMVVAAINEAMKEADNMSESKLSSVAGGINIPGLF